MKLVDKCPAMLSIRPCTEVLFENAMALEPELAKAGLARVIGMLASRPREETNRSDPKAYKFYMKRSSQEQRHVEAIRDRLVPYAKEQGTGGEAARTCVEMAARILEEIQRADARHKGELGEFTLPELKSEPEPLKMAQFIKLDDLDV